MTADWDVSVARWLDALCAECERRRQAIPGGGVDDSRERLVAELDLMAQRMRAAPDWREPTPAEQEQALTEVETWFRERGYLVEEDGRHPKPPRRQDV